MSEATNEELRALNDEINELRSQLAAAGLGGDYMTLARLRAVEEASKKLVATINDPYSKFAALCDAVNMMSVALSSPAEEKRETCVWKRGANDLWETSCGLFNQHSYARFCTGCGLPIEERTEEDRG